MRAASVGKSMKELISVKEARELVRQAAARLAPNWAAEHVALDEVSGRVLAEDVVSQGPYPPFASSAMDGFAVAPVSEAGTVFRVVGESRAGLPFTGVLREGEAVRIATGAVVPDGTAVVVPVEMVDAVAEG